MDDKVTSKLLFRAIMKGQYKPVKIIVDGGADINTTNENGQTPLMKAYLELNTSCTPTINTSSARYKIFQYLLKHGADPTIDDRQGRSVAKMGLSTILNASKSVEKLNCICNMTQENADSKSDFSLFTKVNRACKTCKPSPHDPSQVGKYPTSNVLAIQDGSANGDFRDRVNTDGMMIPSNNHNDMLSVRSYRGRSNTDERILTGNRQHVPSISTRSCKTDAPNTKENQFGYKDRDYYPKRVPVVLLDDINISLND